MQRDATLALEGRELDAKVAEAVFGWEWWTHGYQAGKRCRLHSPQASEDLRAWDGRLLKPVWEGKEGGADLLNLPAYSSTWEGMGAIVNSMAAQGYTRFSLDGRGTPADPWFAYFGGGPLGGAGRWDETAPLAVARAALLALQEEE